MTPFDFFCGDLLKTKSLFHHYLEIWCSYESESEMNLLTIQETYWCKYRRKWSICHLTEGSNRFERIQRCEDKYLTHLFESDFGFLYHNWFIFKHIPYIFIYIEHVLTLLQIVVLWLPKSTDSFYSDVTLFITPNWRIIAIKSRRFSVLPTRFMAVLFTTENRF